jgi:hypothetical protein
MSKKCIWCGGEVNPNVIQGMYYCPRCDEDLTDQDVLPMTVFDKITESVETLAENFICKILTEYDEYKWRGEIGHINWKSEEFDTRAEALIATIEELKKEFNNEEI